MDHTRYNILPVIESAVSEALVDHTVSDTPISVRYRLQISAIVVQGERILVISQIL